MNNQTQMSFADLTEIISNVKSESADTNRRAVLTHHLHNWKASSQSEKKEAVSYYKEILEYKFPDEKITTKIAEEQLQYLLYEKPNIPFPGPQPEKSKFKFIDLFAGIGGFRLALQNLDGICTFSSEWEQNAKITYFENYGQIPYGDITKQSTKDHIKGEFDVLCGGFPCQAFSIAGKRAGFEDTRGTLFFDIEKIVEKKQPKVIFLENVKNLQSHDNGKTFRVMVDILENKLNYKVFSKVLNSMTHANVPQNRERIFIVAFNRDKVKGYEKFEFPDPIPLTKTIHDFLEKGKQDDSLYYKRDHLYYPELKKVIKSKDTVYQWRRIYVRENKSNVCPTLTANMGGGGHNVPLILDDFGIRKLTPKECFAFQGYPMDKYILPKIANSRLYMQAGNSVTTTLIQRIGEQIIKFL
jgi:DNA (cytosine-5)-methyltransferase 1